MIEQKLKLAAASLPEPTMDFLSIEENAKKGQHRADFLYRRGKAVFLSIVIILSLCGGVTVLAITEVPMTTEYGAWTGSGLLNTIYQSRMVDIKLPKEFLGVPLRQTETMSVVPHGTTYLEAMLGEAYIPFRSNYYTERKIEYVDDSSGEAIMQTETIKENNISVSIGTTENDVWKYYFSFNNDGIWCSEYLLPETYYTAQYEGYTLQLGTTYSQYDETDLTHWIHWVDEARNVCVGITADVENLGELEAYAQVIIDLNK